MRSVFYWCFAVVFGIVSCYFITRCISGRYKEYSCNIETIDTNKNVVIESEDGNRLIDVEEYISGILPTQISWEESDDKIELKAIELRTQIYGILGEESVISSKSLNYEYIDEDEWIKRIGREKGLLYKEKYEKAVIKTVGIIN